MELNHLKYFYEVAKAGSFTRASKSLRVSQPSISKIVALLEAREGVRLLDRGRRLVTLTPAGKRVFDSCARIFGEVDSLQLTLKTEVETCAGSLEIGASDNLANYMLPKLLATFAKRHPQVVIRLFSGSSNEIKSRIQGDTLEMGVFYTKLTPFETELEAKPIGFVEFVLILPPEKLLPVKARFDVKTLNSIAYAGSRVNDYSRYSPALDMLLGLGIKPRAFFETNNQEAQKKMVMEGFGYSLVPRHMVEEELKAGLLREIKLPKVIGTELLLCKKKGRTLTKTAATFALELTGKKL